MKLTDLPARYQRQVKAKARPATAHPSGFKTPGWVEAHMPECNSFERRYFNDHIMQTFPPDTMVQFEGVIYDLAQRCIYTPDWNILHNDRLISVEVKCPYQHSRDSRVRFKCASAMHPDTTFIWAALHGSRTQRKRQVGGVWKIEHWKGGRRV